MFVTLLGRNIRSGLRNVGKSSHSGARSGLERRRIRLVHADERLAWFASDAQQHAQVPSDPIRFSRVATRRDPLVKQIEGKIAVPVGSLDNSQIKVLTDSVYNLCKPKGRGRIPKRVFSLADRVFRRVLEEKAKFAIPQKLSSTLVRSAARNGDYRAASSILETLIALHTENPDLHAAPTDYHWSTVLFGCANDASDDALATAEETLRRAEKTGIVTIQMYNNVLLLLSRRSPTHYGAAAAAEDWLLRITAQAADTTATSAIQPTAVTYNLVLLAWGRAPEPEGASRAETVLQVLVRVGEPDAVAFGTVITAYGQRGLAEDAQRILDQAVEVLGSADDSQDLTGCWDAACIAWAQKGAVDAVRQLMETAPANVRVSLTRHNAYLYAMLQNDMVTEAENHLLNVVPGFVPPSLKEFGLLLRYFCYKKQVKEATRFLVQMFSLSSTKGLQCVPSPHDISLVLHGWTGVTSGKTARVNMLELLDLAESRRIVSSDCYTIIIRKFCTLGIPESALSVLKRMEVQVDSERLSWLSPKAALGLYAGVLSALFREHNNDETTNLGLMFLREIPRTGKRAILTTSKAYAAILTALSRAPNRPRAVATLELLDELRKQDEDPVCPLKMDASVLERVLRNLRGGDDRLAFRALGILRSMMELFLSGRHELEPTTGCFDATFKALYAIGGHEESLSLVREIYSPKGRTFWKNLPSAVVLHRCVDYFKQQGHQDIVDELRALGITAPSLCR